MEELGFFHSGSLDKKHRCQLRKLPPASRHFPTIRTGCRERHLGNGTDRQRMDPPLRKTSQSDSNRAIRTTGLPDKRRAQPNRACITQWNKQIWGGTTNVVEDKRYSQGRGCSKKRTAKLRRYWLGSFPKYVSHYCNCPRSTPCFFGERMLVPHTNLRQEKTSFIHEKIISRAFPA